MVDNGVSSTGALGAGGGGGCNSEQPAASSTDNAANGSRAEGPRCTIAWPVTGTLALAAGRLARRLCRVESIQGRGELRDKLTDSILG